MKVEIKYKWKKWYLLFNYYADDKINLAVCKHKSNAYILLHEVREWMKVNRDILTAYKGKWLDTTKLSKPIKRAYYHIRLVQIIKLLKKIDKDIKYKVSFRKIKDNLYEVRLIYNSLRISLGYYSDLNRLEGMVDKIKEFMEGSQQPCPEISLHEEIKESMYYYNSINSSNQEEVFNTIIGEHLTIFTNEYEEWLKRLNYSLLAQ